MTRPAPAVRPRGEWHEREEAISYEAHVAVVEREVRKLSHREVAAYLDQPGRCSDDGTGWRSPEAARAERLDTRFPERGILRRPRIGLRVVRDHPDRGRRIAAALGALEAEEHHLAVDGCTTWALQLRRGLASSPLAGVRVVDLDLTPVDEREQLVIGSGDEDRRDTQGNGRRGHPARGHGRAGRGRTVAARGEGNDQRQRNDEARAPGHSKAASRHGLASLISWFSRARRGARPRRRTPDHGVAPDRTGRALGAGCRSAPAGPQGRTRGADGAA